jgi:hypothetical protein
MKSLGFQDRWTVFPTTANTPPISSWNDDPLIA